MMGGGARTGTRTRPATTLGLPGYQSRQSGAGNKKETVGGAKKNKKSPGKSVAANLLDVLKGQSPSTIRKKSQEGGGRSGSGGGRGVVGSSVTLSRGAPGSSGLGGLGAAGKGKGSGQEVGQDCGFSGNRVCSGQKQEVFDNIELDNLFSGSIIESFQFGIVKVCVNGKIELRRKQDVANDVTIRDKVKLGGGEYHQMNSK